MQTIVCGCWCSFARTGRPEAAGAPEWLPYTQKQHAMMYFDKECEVKSADAEEELAEFLAKHPFMMTQQDRSVEAKLFGGGPRV